MQRLRFLVLLGPALALACAIDPSDPSDPGDPGPAAADPPGAPGAPPAPSTPGDGDAAPPVDAGTGAPSDGGPSPSPLRTFMAPAGDDANDGSSPAKAVRTLARVHALLTQALAGKAWERDVEVRIAPGRYVGQRVDWTLTSPTRSITFLPADGGEQRPVFDGCRAANQCLAASFFRLDVRRGEKTNLVFRSLEVVRYPTAFSFEGNRNAPAQWNGGNRISGCRFADVGNAYAAGLEPSTAAVRLVNSDDNTIENSHFVDVVNTSGAALLHAIYLAHGSDRNVITRNAFVRNSGDPVRVRDFSNGNVITKNRFQRVGIAAAYTEWYCDQDVRDDCTKPTAECPSWNNQFRDNELAGTATCAPLPVFEYFQDDSATGCVRPAGAARLSTSGNAQRTDACRD